MSYEEKTQSAQAETTELDAPAAAGLEPCVQPHTQEAHRLQGEDEACDEGIR
jgi:hypothetical protein